MKSALTLLPVLFLLAHAASAKTPPPAGVSVDSDLEFLAPGRTEKLDLYQPVGRAAGVLSPAVVIIHGGGWVGGDKAAQRESVTGTTLAKAGYVAVSINYWLGAKDRWPTNLQDCKNAVRWLRVNAGRLGIDPGRIGVIGGSAGGHLALMVAYTAGNVELDPKPLYPNVPDHVSACVNMYGISNLSTRQGTDKSGKPDGTVRSTTQLFTESAAAAPEKWKLASPVSHIKTDSPPTLTLHGTADTTVDRAQSEELDRALKAAGADSTLIMVPGANHAWPLKTAKFDHTGDVVEFFDRHLRKLETGHR